jgi:energy-coupling factor transporter ATP-binding protein EcfA2
MSPVRIEQIDIRDFRGFPRELVPPIKLDGKNLLVYGENGSGKSTLFEALSQLFDRSEKLPFDANLGDPRCLKNCFTDEALTVGRVVVDFTLPDGGVAIPSMRWNIGGRRPTDHPFFRTMARQCGFLDYRAMLQTHFVHRDLEGINLFRLIVEVLLREVEIPTKLATFGEEWAAIQEAGGKWLEIAVRDVAKMDDAEKILYGLEPPDTTEGEEEGPPYDEAAAFQSYVAAQGELIGARIGAFNTALWQRVLEVQTVANRFIKLLDPLLDVDFEYHGSVKQPDISADTEWPGEPQLLLRCNFRNRLLQHPAAFLNEARLTAIALAFYLAALKVEVPEAAALTTPEPRLLVLDDVLIGLDMTHRMPVLGLLENEFVSKGWQIVLLTYDRVWFELAQLAFLYPDDWAACEMEIKEVLEGGQSLDVPVLKSYPAKPAEHFIQVARSHLIPPNSDVRAAALYARVALEIKLKVYCSNHKVQVPYDIEGRHLNTDHFLKAVERRLLWDGKMPRVLFMLKQIALFRDGVLNPSAHFHPVTLANSEVEAALQAVESLDLSSNKNPDFAKEAAALVSKTTLNAKESLDAACWLRTAFEVDLRVLLKQHGGTVKFRFDWSKVNLAELWESAKATMAQVNNTLAAPLIADIDAHAAVFLNEWKYSSASLLTKAPLDAAWAALRAAPAPAAPKTRLATFA